MSAPVNPLKFDLPDLAAAVGAGALVGFLSEAHRALDAAAWSALVTDAADAHNAGTLDLLTPFSNLPEGGLRYGGQLFIEHVVPRLAVGLPELAALHDALSRETATQGGVFHLLTGLEGWLQADPSRPLLAVQAALVGSAPPAFLRVGLGVGLVSDRARILPIALDRSAKGTAEERESAMWVLGGFTGFTPTELTRVVTVLEAALLSAAGSAVQAPLRALLTIAKRGPAHDPIGVRALAGVGARADACVRETVAQQMAFEMGKVSASLAQAALVLLGDTDADEHGTIDLVDQILSDTLGGPLALAAQALLDRLLERRVATMKQLDSTAHAILADQGGVQSAIVRRWLLAEDLAVFVAVRDLCSGFGESMPRFAIDFAGASPEDMARAARRSAALLMVFPETMASVFASMLRTGPAAAHPRVEALMFDPLLVNYWSGPREYLQSQGASASPQLAAGLARVFARHDRYMAGIGAAQDIVELRPSQHRRFLVATKHYEEQRAIAQTAQKQSIFAEIMPTSILLYGDAAIYDMYVEPGRGERQEAKMQAREFSHALPTVDIIDPFNSWYQRERLLRDDDA